MNMRQIAPALVAILCLAGPGASAADREAPPRLVLQITVDALRGD